jgi:hypothetical protein
MKGNKSKEKLAKREIYIYLCIYIYIYIYLDKRNLTERKIYEEDGEHIEGQKVHSCHIG